MIKDHRPYFVKRLYLRLESFYVQHFIRPQFHHLGSNPTIMKPWYVELFGPNISLGDHANIVATPDNRVRLSVWPSPGQTGEIQIGDCCFLGPGVRISAAIKIRIKDDCMLASNVYITDSDWHGIYDRISFGIPEPVEIEENVWIGDHAIVCKGVRIRRNSIIGAGSVVTSDIDENSIAAGNPARIIKRIDPKKRLVKRSEWFSDHKRLYEDIKKIDRRMLKGNSLLAWLRHLLFPRRGD